jgi:hypothetical protein
VRALEQEARRAQPVVLVRQRVATGEVDCVHHRISIKPARAPRAGQACGPVPTGEVDGVRRGMTPRAEQSGGTW